MASKLLIAFALIALVSALTDRHLQMMSVEEDGYNMFTDPQEIIEQLPSQFQPHGKYKSSMEHLSRNFFPGQEFTEKFQMSSETEVVHDLTHVSDILLNNQQRISIDLDKHIGEVSKIDGKDDKEYVKEKYGKEKHIKKVLDIEESVHEKYQDNLPIEGVFNPDYSAYQKLSEKDHFRVHYKKNGHKGTETFSFDLEE
mmetsp:Transcript_849/g.774  ORF Transcript_849/g.774 Transcript_849/m.774 type:complete len:198 (+) Transcript_849:61-654(+)